MRSSLVPAVVVLLLLPPARAAGDGDREKLQGTWKTVSGEHEGKPLPTREISKIIVAGDKLTLVSFAKQDETVGYRLDPAKKPKHIDLLFGKDAFPGIYALKGDELRLCLRLGEGKGLKRPAEFKTAPDSGFILLNLKREPKAR